MENELLPSPDYVESQTEALFSSSLARRVDQVEIDISMSSGFSVSAREGELEAVEQESSQGVSITVYRDHAVGSASTTDVSSAGLQQALSKAVSIAQFAEADQYQGLADASCMAEHYPDLDFHHPWSLTIEEGLDLALSMDEVVRSTDTRVLHTESSSVDTSTTWCFYGNSHGFRGHYQYSKHCLSASAVAQDASGKQVDGEYGLHCDPNSLPAAKEIATRAAEKACRRLSSRKIKTGQYPIMFEPSLARSLIRYLLRAVSGYAVYRKTSFLHDALGELVLPDGLSVQQRPHIQRDLYSAPFDDEGVITRDLDIVTEDGRLATYLCDSYTARRLGREVTGTAGGTNNVFVCGQMAARRDLLAEMGSGLLVTDMMGQGVNLLTGDYSRGAAGFWVEQGEIAYPVDEVTIAGNLRQMLLGIRGVGSDIDYRGSIKVGSLLLADMMVAGE